jgi:tetratricopeptide (TPR) repeat protein
LIEDTRRSCLPIFFFICVLLANPFPCFSQEESSLTELFPDEESDVTEVTDEVVAQPLPTQSPKAILPTYTSPFPLLPSFNKIIVPGQVKLDSDTIEQLYQFQLNRGIRNFTTFATFLLNKSQQAIEKGSAEEAVSLAGAAKKMAPDFPQPHWALARAYWAESKINVLLVLKEYLKGYSVALKNFKSILLLSSNIYFVICLAFLLTVVAFALILLGKYFTLIVHDISEFLSQKTSSVFIAYLWAGAIVLLPVVLGLGPVLIACYWLIILAVYVSRKEKQVIWIFFLITILLPWHFGNAASMILASQPGIVNLLHRANYEDWSPEVERQLEGWLIEHPQDTAALLSMGLIAKRDGNYAKAEKLYDELLTLDVTDDKVMGNLANVYLARGDAEKAKETYEKALKINGENAALHYNLYRTYLELYEFLEAREKQQLEIARKLDVETIDRQEKIYSHKANNRVIIDQALTLSQIWNKVFLRTEQQEALASSIWFPFLKGVSYRFGIFVFIAFSLLISFLFFQDAHKKFAARCNKCGIPMKKKGRPKQLLKLPDICFHCLSIFFEKKKIDQKVKEKKEAQVRGFQSRQDLIWRILTFGLPGAGHLWIGIPGLAVLYLFLFFCFVLKIVFWNGILRDPFAFHTSSSFLQIAFFVLCFLGFYLFVLWHSFRKKERLGDYVQIFQAIRKKSPQKEAEPEDREQQPKKGLPGTLRL